MGKPPPKIDYRWILAIQKFSNIVGEDLLFRALNSDYDALEELGHKIASIMKEKKLGPVSSKDQKFLDNLRKLKDR